MAAVMGVATAANQGTPWLRLTKSGVNLFTVTIGGTFVATVTMEMKRDGQPDNSSIPFKTYTAPLGERGQVNGPWLVRARVLNGQHTSGSVRMTVYSDD